MLIQIDAVSKTDTALGINLHHNKTAHGLLFHSQLHKSDFEDREHSHFQRNKCLLKMWTAKKKKRTDAETESQNKSIMSKIK